MYLQEDEVSYIAQQKTNIENINAKNFRSGIGQRTSFKSLGIDSNKKPDGWVLYPKNTNASAIILEFKSSDKDIDDPAATEELKRNCEIVFFDKDFDTFDADYSSVPVYKNVLGILYNGISVRYFLFYQNKKGEIILGERQTDYPPSLQTKEYYVNDGYDGGKVHVIPINKEEIYKITAAINNLLHFKFNVKELYHRMIFTACALVVTSKNSAALDGSQSFSIIRQNIKESLESLKEDDPSKITKISSMVKVFDNIESHVADVSQIYVRELIENIKEIAANVNSHQWNGEDVMGIFFNEFNRYKGKSENGQVFTPEHIVSLICKLLDIRENDHVLDAACGSGAFLAKAMCMMVNNVGGEGSDRVEDIKCNNLYGVEYDTQVYALACANMLIHKDGRSNLYCGNSTSQTVHDWIADKGITKVVMNPPYENKYGCMKIVANVLDAVTPGAQCAFILPDKKLEKCAGDTKRILKEHSLDKIIKLPENTFDVGVTTSIFIFTAHKPMDFNKDIFTCYIEDDGLERVKNQGRQDVKNHWKDIEPKWEKIINDTRVHDTVKWLKPNMQHLSYQMPEQEVVLFEEDFIKTLVDYQLFLDGTDVKALKEEVASDILSRFETGSIFRCESSLK